MDVLCIGSAVVDISASPIGDSRKWEEKQRIDEINLQAGGDALNQSIRMADSGLDVGIVAAVGMDTNGNLLKSQLEQRNVRTEYLGIRKDLPTGTALVLIDEMGNRHIFSVKGAHSSLGRENLPDLELLWKNGKLPKALSLASLFSMPELEENGLYEYLQQAKAMEILVFADLASDKKKAGIKGIQRFLPYIDYFLPSEYDALQMTKQSRVEDAAQFYQDAGAKTVIIKCGEAGCYEKTCKWIPTQKVNPVDTTGAGDCMVGLFISRILKGDSLPNALRYACAGATLSTLKNGASTNRLDQNKIHV